MTASHFPVTAGLITENTLQQIQAYEKATSEKYLSKIASDMRNNGLDVDWVYKKGLASTQIIATAKEQNADLIAMATHTNGEVAWNLGSVSEKVMKHTSCVKFYSFAKKFDRLLNFRRLGEASQSCQHFRGVDDTVGSGRTL
jgi:nucleotide-binding universal stress UspA family protein